MKGQISIDYVAGALIFFGSLVFLVSNVMGTLPAFSQAQQTDELTLSAWSMSEVVMKDEGYWRNGTHSGDNWQDHLGSVEVLGVKEGNEISGEKINAFTGLNQSWLRSAFNTEKKVNVEFREVVNVDTHRSFQRGSPPGFITEPAYSGGTADEIRYGAKELSGEERHFLLVKNPGFGWYNRVRVSTGWDFTGSDTYNLTDTRYIPVGGGTYVTEAANTEVSGGNLLILWRDLGRTGDVPGESVDEIVSVDRYGVMDGNVVEVTFRVWE